MLTSDARGVNAGATATMTRSEPAGEDGARFGEMGAPMRQDRTIRPTLETSA